MEKWRKQYLKDKAAGWWYGIWRIGLIILFLIAAVYGGPSGEDDYYDPYEEDYGDHE